MWPLPASRPWQRTTATAVAHLPSWQSDTSLHPWLTYQFSRARDLPEVSQPLLRGSRQVQTNFYWKKVTGPYHEARGQNAPEPGLYTLIRKLFWSKNFNQSDGALMLFSHSNYHKVPCYKTLLWQCNANSSWEIASFWTVFTFVFRWKYKRCNTRCLRADSALRIKEVQYTQVIGLNRKTTVLHITPLFNQIFLKGQKVVGENLTVKSKQSMTPIIRYVTLQMPISNCELNKKKAKNFKLSRSISSRKLPTFQLASVNHSIANATGVCVCAPLVHAIDKLWTWSQADCHTNTHL